MGFWVELGEDQAAGVLDAHAKGPAVKVLASQCDVVPKSIRGMPDAVGACDGGDAVAHDAAHRAFSDGSGCRCGR
jgi:hypothetical protein